MVFTVLPQAFRPGIVDMAEDQVAVNRNAITLQEKNIDLDLLLPNINLYEKRNSGVKHILNI